MCKVNHNSNQHQVDFTTRLQDCFSQRAASSATLVAPDATPARDHHAHVVMAVEPAARSPSAARSAGHSALGRLLRAPQLANA
jgi:hypothetical protein